MARRPFIAGNWKMNLDLAGAVALAKALVREAEGKDGVDLAVCPPSVYLESVGKAVAGTKVGLGAQNMYSEKKGAFTGEVSAADAEGFRLHLRDPRPQRTPPHLPRDRRRDQRQGLRGPGGRADCHRLPR